MTPDLGLLRHSCLVNVAPDPKRVNLSFAGRLVPDHPSLGAIAAAQVGNPVTLDQRGGRGLIRDGQGGVRST